ncbi:MAG: endonuclease III domain-containing protein [Deltaproteobacteria bacterium]|nr:endonuclease III domain-containing protein [Deltaproteobacteria bacterium]
MKEPTKTLQLIYGALNDHFGDLHWWPGESSIEIIIGAILTQNTAWRNVEIAINRLGRQGLLDQKKLLCVKDEILEELIKPSGYYRIKAKRLKAFIHFLFEYYHGKLDDLFDNDIDVLRSQLLRVKGIGEETADSIILYAAEKPIFVVDAYTRRILERHSLIEQGLKYGDIQKYFMNHLPADVYLFKQYHGLIVNTGKTYCTKAAKCEMCPLQILIS